MLEFFTDKSEEPNQQVLDVMRMLGIQFGRILERRRAVEELQAAREELEKRVAERTAELSQANEALRTEVTDRKRAQAELQALFTISSILAETGAYEDKLNDVMQELERVAEADWVILRVPGPQEGGLRTLVRVGKDESPFPDVLRGTGVSFDVMETGKTVVINDYQSHPDALPSNIAGGVKSLITLPIKGTEETLGVAGAVSKDADHFNPERVRLLTAIVDGIGPLLENAELHEDLLDSNRRLEETLVELRQMQGRMVSQERLRALGTMASGIAHDFNNALGPILGFSDILLTYPDALDDKEKANEYLQTINNAAKDAVAVISRLREFYRARDDDELTMPVDLNQMIATVISITRPRWRDMAQARGINITFRTQLADDLPTIGGNEPGLRSALTNLIFNAVDAMPEGGDLEISTYLDNDEVVVKVRDTGQGMTEEVLRHAMEPFFTTKGEEGSGLGLAMVHGIIERHEGRVDIESKPGEGTSVIIYLPYRPLPGHLDEPADENFPRGLRVLVVDDDQVSVDLLAEYLTRDGHTVETSRNGREALEKFYHGEIDMVITDRAIPEMGGDQLATAIKGIAAGTPVIMVTGTSEDITTPGERAMGIDFFVTKPISITALRQAMAAVWSR